MFEFDSPYYRTEKCSESTWGYIEIKSNIVNISVSKEDNKLVLVVLESPHVKEYSNKNGMFNTKNIEAAQGQTRTNFTKNILHLMNKYQKSSSIKIPDGNYEVILENAIPYQCSRGLSTSIYRDVVWLHNWINRSYRRIFIKMLIDKKPNVIFNLCTVGKHTSKFKDGGNITAEYLQQFVGNLPVVGQDIKFNSLKIYDKNYRSNNSIKAFSQKHYSLRGFVQTAIDEYKSKNPSVMCLVGTSHPSSIHFGKSSLFEV